jgi:hypothetical protein
VCHRPDDLPYLPQSPACLPACLPAFLGQIFNTISAKAARQRPTCDERDLMIFSLSDGSDRVSRSIRWDTTGERRVKGLL